MTSDRATPDLEANKAIVRSIVEQGWNRGAIDEIADCLAPEIQFHFRGQSWNMGVEDLRRLVGNWHNAFPDLHLQIHETIAEGDLLAARLTLTGTHSGVWKGIEPTGRQVAVSHMWFFRLRDGRLVEVWEVNDEYGMRQQLGLLD